MSDGSEARDAAVAGGARPALTPELEEAIRPRRAHDDLPFEQLSERYNFRLTSDRRRVFARLVMKECERARERSGSATVLDIGCGRGIGRALRYTQAIRTSADELWGLEPDEGVTPQEGLFDRFQHALMETADLPENRFDVAYSFMVMEHVAEPEKYLSALARVMKPGGVHLFMTPNAGHYFTILARVLHKLRLDEFVLGAVKAGKEEDYHYPVQYRSNAPKQITAQAEAAGFTDCRYAFLESEGPESYMRGPLKIPYAMLRLKRRAIRNPRCLLTLVARMTKAG